VAWARICRRKHGHRSRRYFRGWKRNLRGNGISFAAKVSSNLLQSRRSRPECAKAIANKQASWISSSGPTDGRPGVAYRNRSRIGADTVTDHDPSNRAQEVILRDMIFSRRELHRQRRLRLLQCSIITNPPTHIRRIESGRRPSIKHGFFSHNRLQTGLRLRPQARFGSERLRPVRPNCGQSGTSLAAAANGCFQVHSIKGGFLEYCL